MSISLNENRPAVNRDGPILSQMSYAAGYVVFGAI
jgi:hypothetical protein